MAATPSSSSSTTQGGLGFVGALTIAFIVLKLTGVIAWSWWWVLSPAWIAAAVGVLFVVVVVVLAVISVSKKPRR